MKIARRSGESHLVNCPARGITIVEILVTITIIGLLVALLLPAIASSRESARRIACQNNLKQLALAVHNYHDVHRTFPLGAITAPLRTDLYAEEGYGWGTAILPYLDQSTLYLQLREPFLTGGSGPQGTPGVFIITYDTTGRILTGGDTHLTVFRCPTSLLDPNVSNSGLRYFDGYATSDYKGSRGPHNNGIFLKVSNALVMGTPSIEMRDVNDGSSNTISIGESAYFNKPINQPVWIGAGGQDETCLFKTIRTEPINCFLTQQSIQGMLTTSQDDCAFSWHSGGAYFAFVDGSVHFLADDIDGTLYERLGSRNDGNPVSLE